jgi:hypothetical protein
MVPLQDLQFLGFRGVGYANLEQKAVQLRFRQGVGALKVHRVLGGEDGEPGGQGAARAVGGDLALFHAFEQGGLCARRHAVDLVHQQQVSEDRAGVEGKGLRAGTQEGGAQNVGGHEVGRGLDALEAEAQKAAECLDDEGFGDARHALKQSVALAENGEQHLLDHLSLSGDHAAQFGAGMSDELAGGAERFHWLDHGVTGILNCILIQFRIRFLAHEALSCGLE